MTVCVEKQSACHLQFISWGGNFTEYMVFGKICLLSELTKRWLNNFYFIIISRDKVDLDRTYTFFFLINNPFLTLAPKIVEAFL